MPDVEPRSARPDEPAEPLLVQLRDVADGLSAIAPLVSGIESRLDQLPIEAQSIEVELRRFLVIVDIGRVLLAERTTQVIGSYQLAAAPGAGQTGQAAIDTSYTARGWQQRPERIMVAELAVHGLPRDAVGVAWPAYEECSVHALRHAPGRAGVQPGARGVVLYDADGLDCSDCHRRR